MTTTKGTSRITTQRHPLRQLAVCALLATTLIGLSGSGLWGRGFAGMALAADLPPVSEKTAEKTSEATAPAKPPAMAKDGQLPQEVRDKIDSKKLQVAKDLTDWLNHTLQEKKALVAVVGREGSAQTKQQDRTGMGHAGLAVYDPRAQSWIIYNLLNDLSDASPKGNLWRTAPVDFFYGQKGYERDALLLIPDEVTQKRIYSAILQGKNKSLFFTGDYNLVSAYDTRRSLNCNKWLLMNVVAARIDDYNVDHVLKAIHDGFEPGEIHLNPIKRQIAKTRPTVLPDEVPLFGPIQTVTVESLYRSDLFAEKRFYSGRTSL